MPKRKYSSSNSTSKKRRVYRRNFKTPAQLQREVAKNSTILKKVTKTIERKNMTYVQPSSSISTAGLNHNGFLYVGEGDGDNDEMPALQRTGDSITLLTQRLSANFTVSGSDNYNQVRFILVESIDGNTQLTLSDVLEYSNYATHQDLVFVSPKKLEPAAGKRYKVHFDRTFEMSAFANQGSSGKGTKQFNVAIKYGKTGKVVKYDGASSVQPINHRLHLMCISDSVSIGHPAVTYTMRSTYLDA